MVNATCKVVGPHDFTRVTRHNPYARVRGDATLIPVSFFIPLFNWAGLSLERRRYLVIFSAFKGGRRAWWSPRVWALVWVLRTRVGSGDLIRYT